MYYQNGGGTKKLDYYINHEQTLERNSSACQTLKLLEIVFFADY